MSDELFREVEEEVRQERYQRLWKRYGAYALAAAAVIIGAAIAFVVWRDAQQGAREADSTRFLDAVVQQTLEPGDALSRMQELARDGTPAYRFLARLREGGLLAGEGDRAQSVAVFDSIAADGDLPGIYRDIARLLAVANGMETLSRSEVEQRIGSIDSDGNPFRATAREFLASAAIREGDSEGAAEWLRANQGDPDAPVASRARATELLTAIGL